MKSFILLLVALLSFPVMAAEDGAVIQAAVEDMTEEELNIPVMETPSNPPELTIQKVNDIATAIKNPLSGGFLKIARALKVSQDQVKATYRAMIKRRLAIAAAKAEPVEPEEPAEPLPEP